MNRLMITVEQISYVLQYYDQIKVYRADSEGGAYTEITDVNTRIDIIPEQTIYFYYDDTGDSTKWYKTSYFNSSTLDESALSTARQGGTEEEKIGYSFGNYSPPSNIWGKVLTADDLRYTFAWGIDMVASDELGSEIDEKQLDFVIENALGEFEHHFNIDIRKRVYITQPDSSLVQAEKWVEGVDYTDEDDPYDFNEGQWKNYGFIQLRHHPIISIERAEMYSPWDLRLIDVLDWLRIYKEPGQVAIYPKGQTLFGKGYVGAGIVAAWPYIFGTSYPHGFKFDYTTGYKNSDLVPKDLRNAIGMLATINLLGWMGDGLMAGFSSSSVSLDNLSESFSSTQSATSAYFGARIKSYTDQLKEFIKHNKYKYANIPMGMISGR